MSEGLFVILIEANTFWWAQANCVFHSAFHFCMSGTDNLHEYFYRGDRSLM